MMLTALLVVLACVGALAALAVGALVAGDLWTWHRGGRSAVAGLVDRYRARKHGAVPLAIEWTDGDGVRQRAVLGIASRIEVRELFDALEDSDEPEGGPVCGPHN